MSSCHIKKSQVLVCPSFFPAPPPFFLIFLEFISLARKAQQVKGDLSSQEALSHDTFDHCDIVSYSTTLLHFFLL